MHAYVCDHDRNLCHILFSITCSNNNNNDSTMFIKKWRILIIRRRMHAQFWCYNYYIRNFTFYSDYTFNCYRGSLHLSYHVSIQQIRARFCIIKSPCSGKMKKCINRKVEQQNLQKELRRNSSNSVFLLGAYQTSHQQINQSTPCLLYTSPSPRDS